MYLDSHQYEEVKEIMQTFYSVRRCTLSKEELARRQSMFVKIVTAHVFVGLIVFWKFPEFPRWGYLLFWASCWTWVSLVNSNKDSESKTTSSRAISNFVEEIKEVKLSAMERELFFCLLEAVQEKESDIDELVKEALRSPNLRSLQFVQDLEAVYCKKVLV